MKVILNNTQLKKIIKLNQNIGFVPTMGSLHKGHISLIKESKKKSKKTLVSIFVNPKQFNDKKDFINYPRNIDKDIWDKYNKMIAQYIAGIIEITWDEDGNLKTSEVEYDPNP